MKNRLFALVLCLALVFSAAALADFTSSDEYAVVGYPAPLSFMEQLMQQFGSAEPEIGINKFLNYQPGKFYARLPYELELSF